MIIKSTEKNTNKATIVVEIEKELMNKGAEIAYKKQRKNIRLPGFRPGKAPRKMIEKMYGEFVFFEDAIEELFPEIYDFAIDDERLFPVYDALQDSIPVMLHMGDPRYPYSHPARLRRVLDLFPRLNVIAAHFGGYRLFHTAWELLRDTDCIFDTSSALMFMERGEAEHYINAYGAERMAYGTDSPLWDPVTEMKRFMQLKLTDEQFDQILHKTAERVLKL